MIPSPPPPHQVPFTRIICATLHWSCQSLPLVSPWLLLHQIDSKSKRYRKLAVPQLAGRYSCEGWLSRVFLFLPSDLLPRNVLCFRSPPSAAASRHMHTRPLILLVTNDLFLIFICHSFQLQLSLSHLHIRSPIMPYHSWHLAKSLSECHCRSRTIGRPSLAPSPVLPLPSSPLPCQRHRSIQTRPSRIFPLPSPLPQ